MDRLNNTASKTSSFLPAIQRGPSHTKEAKVAQTNSKVSQILQSRLEQPKNSANKRDPFNLDRGGLAHAMFRANHSPTLPANLNREPTENSVVQNPRNRIVLSPIDSYPVAELVPPSQENKALKGIVVINAENRDQ